jgi:hypothetical protein
MQRVDERTVTRARADVLGSEGHVLGSDSRRRG